MKNKFLCLGLMVLLVLPLVMAVSQPAIPRPHVRDIAYDESRVVFRPLLSILVDKETINLGESATFTIDLSTTEPDDDYSDGSYAVQYAGWVFTDESGNIIEKKEFERAYGNFSDTIMIKPTKSGEYALVGLIIQYDQTYDTITGTWITSPEEVLVKDARKLTVITPAPPTLERPSIGEWISNFFTSIIDWVKGLFGG